MSATSTISEASLLQARSDAGFLLAATHHGSWHAGKEAFGLGASLMAAFAGKPAHTGA